MKAILGRKAGMTQVFDENGVMVPVTIIETLPNTVIQKKTKDKDGYEAIRVGYEDKKENKLNSPEKGVFKKAKVEPKKFIRELKGEKIMSYKEGEQIKADIFEKGDIVDVSGVTKGKGFTGHIKRWNHSIGRKSHGSQHHRAHGSIASGITKARLFPGTKMAGRHGHFKRTILNLEVVNVDLKRNAILIKGAIPGPNKGLVTIKSAVKNGKNKKKDPRTLVDYSSKESK